MLEGFKTLLPARKQGAYDLRARMREDGSIQVLTNITDTTGIWSIKYTVEEIEALYYFAQIAKNNR